MSVSTDLPTMHRAFRASGSMLSVTKISYLCANPPRHTTRAYTSARSIGFCVI
jgi:hypothetical protein